MLPKRRRARAGTPGADSSAARFPGVAVYLAEPHMGRSRRAFLTRLALSKGFRVLDAYRCAGSEQLPRAGTLTWGAGGRRARRPRPRPSESRARPLGWHCAGASGRRADTAARPPPGLGREPATFSCHVLQLRGRELKDLARSWPGGGAGPGFSIPLTPGRHGRVLLSFPLL